MFERVYACCCLCAIRACSACAFPCVNPPACLRVCVCLPVCHPWVSGCAACMLQVVVLMRQAAGVDHGADSPSASATTADDDELVDAILELVDTDGSGEVLRVRLSLDLSNSLPRPL